MIIVQYHNNTFGLRVQLYNYPNPISSDIITMNPMITHTDDSRPLPLY